MTDTRTKQTEDWEKEFEKNFVCWFNNKKYWAEVGEPESPLKEEETIDMVKDFIRQEIEAARREALEFMELTEWVYQQKIYTLSGLKADNSKEALEKYERQGQLKQKYLKD